MEPTKITPTPKQCEAHKLLEDNTFVLYGGAIRGAKSYWGCLEIITFCFKYPRSRWALVRESWGNIEGKLYVTFLENFLQKGFDQYVKEFNKNTWTLTWVNGSQIVFMAESYNQDKELNRFRGLEINGAFIDEINEIQEVTFDKIIERSGSWFHSPGCPTKILASCNPTTVWVKDRFYDKWEAGQLPKGMAYIQARIYDNPYIPAEYLESLKLLPRFQYEVFVEGNWNLQLKTGGEFYKCFELDLHVKPVKYNPSLALHISWDDNVNPYLPCGIFQIVSDKTTGYDELIMIDEIAGQTPNNKIDKVCNEFKRRYPNHTTGLFVYGDATANKEDTKTEAGHNFFRMVIDNLRQYKPSNRVLSSNPSVIMRGNWINTIFEKEIGKLKITIGDNCKKTIEDLVKLKEAADGTKLKELETDAKTHVRFQKYGHFTDLLDYIMCSAFGSRFAKYQAGDIVSNISTGRNKPSKNSY
jgi:hypothetical protein